MASIHSVTAQSGASGPDKTTRHKDKEKKPRHKGRYNHTQSGASGPDKTPRHKDKDDTTRHRNTDKYTNTDKTPRYINTNTDRQDTHRC